MALDEFWDLAKGGGSGASRQDFGVSKLNLYGLYWGYIGIMEKKMETTLRKAT